MSITRAGLTPPPQEAEQQANASCHQQRLQRARADLLFQGLRHGSELLATLRIVLRDGLFRLRTQLLRLRAYLLGRVTDVGTYLLGFVTHLGAHVPDRITDVAPQFLDFIE